MAVTLPSDLLVDVMKAADPQQVAAARATLTARSGGAAGRTSDVSFPTDLAPPPPRATEPTDPRADAFKKFEAMVLQNFLKSMLPEGTESVYGNGLAGDMWKGLMAEKLADAVADRGGIGIASTLLKDHVKTGEDTILPVRGVDRNPDRAAIDEQQRLSTGLVERIQLSILAPREDAGDDAPKAPGTV